MGLRMNGLRGNRQIAPAEPPPRVVTTFDAFVRTKVHQPYDALFCGQDWLQAGNGEPCEGGDFRHALPTLLNVSRASAVMPFRRGW